MRLTLTILLALWAAMAAAQQPRKVTERYFPDPVVEIATPSLAKAKGFASHGEVLSFFEALGTAHPDRVSVEVAGLTQKKREIPLVKISSGGGGKLRMLLFARVHGDEPSGTEALMWLADRLVNDPASAQMLESIDFYLMPVVNADGMESFQRMTANGIDLNRDQSKLDSPEAQVLHATAARIAPHVTVDLHEYQPVRSDFETVAQGRIISTPWDVMLLWSGNLNVPAPLRATVEEVMLPPAYKLLDANGLTHHTYYTSHMEHGVLSMTVGGSSARSTSNAMALRNSVSLLVETRGIKLDRTSFKRRVWSAYLLCDQFARTAYDNAAQIMATVEEAAKSSADIAVRFAGERKKGVPFTFIDLISGGKVSIALNAQYSLRSTATLTRVRPSAYYILPGEKRAAEKLDLLGIAYTRLAEPATLDVEAYTVETVTPETVEVGGVLPVAVRTAVQTRSVSFPEGTVVVGTGQPMSHFAVSVLEPECTNSFAYFRIIETTPGAEYPVYRYMTK